MPKALRVEVTKSGMEVCSGTPKLIIIGGWMKTDEETGFISQPSIDGVLHIIARKMIDMKFTKAKTEEQSLTVVGDTLIITQALRASGKRMKIADAEMAARGVMEQFFTFATKNGYFDEVDPLKLQESVEDEGGEVAVENLEEAES